MKRRRVPLRMQLAVATNKIHILERALQDAWARIVELQEELKSHAPAPRELAQRPANGRD